MRFPLFAGDGSLWRRDKVQQAIKEVENWAGDWGFRFSVSKTFCEIFTNKKVASNIKLYLYGEPLEKVDVVMLLQRYLEPRFDKRLP